MKKKDDGAGWVGFCFGLVMLMGALSVLAIVWQIVVIGQ